MTILASTVNVKTMADDSLRLTIDISPGDAQAAFALFGARGVPCVIARLTPEASIASQQAETVASNTVTSPADEKPKGGDLAKLAGMFCQQAEFLEWARVAFSWYPHGAMNADDAAACIREVCDIESRAELDHNERAEIIFHEQIRRPYAAWRKERGLS